ncbi:MAG: DNA polymerase III subunit alpha [Candidatus Nanopelagicales bacterium]
MPDPFVHLRTVSSFSLRHGVSTPEDLVGRVADLGQSAIALTDRDGLYGAVKFAQACRDAGIAPILGADLALVHDSAAEGTAQPTRRSPARGGQGVWDPGSRLVVLARGGRGWAALCRLVSAAHLRGERSKPAVTREIVAEYAQQGDLIVMLGADSEVGRALERRRADVAAAELRWWLGAVGVGSLRIDAASHQSRSSATVPGFAGGSERRTVLRSSAAAARLLGLAADVGVGAVLTNAVRYAEASAAPVADVLDAIRRLVPLDLRHLDRANAQGYLKSWSELRPVAQEVLALAGRQCRGDLSSLLAGTAGLAEECALDPQGDVGLGDIHVPELSVLDGGGGLSGTRDATSILAGYAGRRRSHAQVDAEAREALGRLRARCEGALDGYVTRSGATGAAASDRLAAELATIGELGFAGYFLTVTEVVDLIRDMGVRVAARGSGAGSLVNNLLGISGVDPLRHDLLMERFLSPLRRSLPDIDVDVESARRSEVYERILDRFGGDRCACVSMRDTYRVRHAIRDVGAALGMPPGEVDAFAKAFPHIRAKEVRSALMDLPELRASGLGVMAARGELDVFLDLVESLDGLPRHIAVHPCGVLLSDATMLDRTPVEASWMGFPMSQFDKDEVEALGFLKLDVLGIRMQSAMQHAVAEIGRVDGLAVDLDEVPLDDQPTYDMIRTTRTLGCFQIESPGQRELIGKLAPETFDDIIVDISLFRPGPVKSDMITPFLAARHGWREPKFIHEDLRPALAETCGVVVYHEQVLRVVAVMTGCSHAEADEVRRSMGSPEGQQQVRGWFYRLAHEAGYALSTIEEVWEVLRAFASFGFCKAHAAAFALPTYQSAWLKTHHPAAFLAGVLTHDPGMYPKRLILADARQLGIAVLPLDVNRSGADYRVEPVGRPEEPGALGSGAQRGSGAAYGIRLALSEVKGIGEEEVASIVASQPYAGLQDFWSRSGASRPTVEGLIVTGGFDSVCGLAAGAVAGQITRRDLLLQAADLDRVARLGRRSRGRRKAVAAALDTVAAARAQSRAAEGALGQPDVQLALELVDPAAEQPSGLPDMSVGDRVQAELSVLGLDVSSHLIGFYSPMLRELGAVRSTELLGCRSQQEILVAGVKVATQTPPIRTGHRVVFLTVDDGAGPIDATFFPDAQDPYAQVVFHSWLLLVRGRVRRTGPRGVSLRATGCWDLAQVQRLWSAGGAGAVHDLLEGSARPGESPAAGMGRDPGRVWLYASGFRKSPYADIKPAGADAADGRGIVREAAEAPAIAPSGGPPGKLWHSSPGSSGW